MHKNYFLFEQLIREIKPQILGNRIGIPFTYQKDELIIPLQNQRYVRISVSPEHPYLLVTEEKSLRQPALDLFPELNGQRILDIGLKPFDKHFIMELEAYTLEALFYAPYFNIFLSNHEHTLISKFKEKSEYPHETGKEKNRIALSALQSDQVRQLLESEREESIFAFLKKHFVALNNLLLNEIFFRLDLPKEQIIGQLSSEEVKRFVQTLEALHSEMNEGRAYLYFRNRQVERIAVLRLRHLENSSEFRVETFDSLNTALRVFYRELTYKQEVGRLRNLCIKALQKRLDYLQNSLKKLNQHADLEKRKELAQLKGHLLLTFKSEIPKGAKEVELENIFSEQHEKIRIKLNPVKSVTENAQKYFNKFKHLNEEKRLHAIRRDTYRKELVEIRQLLSQVAQINDLSRLKKFAQKLKDMKILPGEPVAKQHKLAPSHLKYSFRRLILDKEWDVYIGKDGPNNELLTFRFANKWDIWLHAQGVPGSHVIIRLPSRQHVPPKHVIEQAAQIAAANSKARHASTVPVMYTEVRYVSRIRKAPPGTVKVQNEKVMFVKPLEIK